MSSIGSCSKASKVGETEDEIAEALEPLVQKTREIIGNSD
jgi:hypothetical protein